MRREPGLQSLLERRGRPNRDQRDYVRVPENRLSLTVVESISEDGKPIPLLIIDRARACDSIPNWLY